MATINKGLFAKSLWPGVHAWWGDAYNEHTMQYPELFDMEYSSKAFEEDVQFVGMGMASVVAEGGSVTFDSMKQGFLTRYTHIKYGLGFILTDEMIEDDQYGVIAKKSATAIGYSMRQAKETVAANVYIRAFNSNFTLSDGKEMCATDHPNISGGTWQNELSTASDLSEAALEQACIDIGDWTNDRGLKISARPLKLIIPNELQFEAERILTSTLRVGLADNDPNAIRQMGKFPGGVVMNNYLTDADAWFIRTDVKNSLMHYERRADALSDDIDFGSDNIKYKATARYSFGVTDQRGIFGSPG